jgi:CheY-like chemotaxis protein
LSINILIVDDSKLARIVMAKAIRALHPDWNRIEASNADEALAILDAQRIDVVLLDFNMPKKDGLTLAGELRARFPVMPIALATANVQDEVVARARAVGVTFITKPLTEDSLRGFLSGAASRLCEASR